MIAERRTVSLAEGPVVAVSAHRKRPMAAKNTRKSSRGKWWVLRRILVSLFTVLLCAVVAVVSACYVLLNGPSTTMRDALVLSAMQASATKWVPGLFLEDQVVQSILDSSNTVKYDVIPITQMPR